MSIMQYFLVLIAILNFSHSLAFVQQGLLPRIEKSQSVQVQTALHAEPSSSSSSTSETTTTKTRIPTPIKPQFDEVDEVYLSQQTKGGYTIKQRLREEVESPFRKVRLVFFGSSTGSALTALYFSALSTIKALSGGYSDAPPLDEALTSDLINIGAAIICGVLAYREYTVGEKNLERIARGGKLASMVVEPAYAGSKRLQLSNYRRSSRVLIAAGGKEYISTLARSLNADQLQDTNIIPEKLSEVDVVVVPILLELTNNGKVVVGDTRSQWKNDVKPMPETDRNFDITRSDSVIAFPIGNSQWRDYLESEIETASGQGFDVLQKGITLMVKKNGRILRRATGQPPWSDLINTLEVMDGSRFGMPGDSERYGGP